MKKRGNDGKTTSKSGLTLNGISYYGKPRKREEWGKLVAKSTVVPQGVIPVTCSLVLKRLSCQMSSVTESALGLDSPVSMYCK